MPLPRTVRSAATGVVVTTAAATAAAAFCAPWASSSARVSAVTAAMAILAVVYLGLPGTPFFRPARKLRGDLLELGRRYGLEVATPVQTFRGDLLSLPSIASRFWFIPPMARMDWPARNKT